jgi:hypothetical protein
MSELFRFKFEPDERYELMQGLTDAPPTDDEVRSFSRDKVVKLLEKAISDYQENPSRKNRLKKVWAAGLMRDYDYGRANYKYIRAVGYNGLFMENYKSSSKLDALI